MLHFAFNEIEKGKRVRNSDLYDKTRGYGFITDKNEPVPGLGNHFTLPSYYKDEDVVKISETKEGVCIDQAESCKRLDADEGRLIPLMFAADVSEYGNYRVRVKFTATGEVLVFTGSRRLSFRQDIFVRTTVNICLDVNVSRIIPRGQTEPGERRTVFVSLLGQDAVLSEIEIEKADTPTVFIYGDSTVTDQPADYPWAPGSSYSGWGQMLSDHLQNVAVSNHAHSGLTTESFRSEGHYDIARKMLKAGDYVMMQFAHNDQKLAHLKAKEGYRDRVVAYINETREAGAFPIIVTPLARNTWKPDKGGYNDLLKEYAEECFEIGKDFEVPVVDLHGFSMNEILKDGLESSKRFYFPKDYTHTNDYGAYKMSRYIAGELEKLTGDYAPLAKAVTVDDLEWKTDEIPVVPEIPERFKNREKQEEVSGTFSDVERPDDKLLRAEALDMVIKAAKFFPTNVFNDIYDDIVGHEWYAGTVQCAFQNGIIPKGMVTDGKFRPEEKVTLEDLMCFTVSACGSRKSLPAAKKTRYDSVCDEYAKQYMGVAVALGLIGEDEDPKRTVIRKDAAKLCSRLGL